MEFDRAAHDLSADVAPEDLRRQARHSSGFLERFTTAATNWTGRNSAFACAMMLVNLFINTITSVVTFVMVFVIQRAQNKDTLALQVKVNELIAAHKHAHNSLIAVERLSEEELRMSTSQLARQG